MEWYSPLLDTLVCISLLVVRMWEDILVAVVLFPFPYPGVCTCTCVNAHRHMLVGQLQPLIPDSLFPNHTLTHTHNRKKPCSLSLSLSHVNPPPPPHALISHSCTNLDNRTKKNDLSLSLCVCVSPLSPTHHTTPHRPLLLPRDVPQRAQRALPVESGWRVAGGGSVRTQQTVLQQ